MFFFLGSGFLGIINRVRNAVSTVGIGNWVLCLIWLTNKIANWKWFVFFFFFLGFNIYLVAFCFSIYVFIDYKFRLYRIIVTN